MNENTSVRYSAKFMHKSDQSNKSVTVANHDRESENNESFALFH